MHRTLVLPGRNTIGLIAVLVAMWYAGVAQSNGAAHLLCFLLAALAAVSTIHAWSNLRAARVRVGKIAPTFVGERVLIPLIAEAEPGKAPAAIQIDAGDPEHSAHFESLQPGHEQRAIISLAGSQRGQFTKVRLMLLSRYPLGFFTARRRSVVEQRFFVYPRPAGTAPIPRAPTGSRERREGTRVEGDDFAGVRTWLQGESQRHIDWKAAARGQPLLTKQWAGDSGETVQLDWRDTPPGDVEARLSQLAQWIVTAEQAGTQYGLTMPGRTIEPSQGDAHYHACLETLATFRAEENAP